MDESYRDLIVRGIAAAKVNDKNEARFYLEWVLRLEPPIEQRVDAWFWLSEVSDDPQQKRNFLEEVLCYQPGHQPARRSLAILDGRLDPSEIIDPVHLPAEGDAGHQPLHPQRYDCPHCGGRMVFQPDGRTLICEYCNGRRAIANPVKQETSQDFTVAMATVRGHKIPVNTHSFECKACGAIFLLSPQILSLDCPYCDSIYAFEVPESRTLVPPDLLVPFSIDRGKAVELLSCWMNRNALKGEPADLLGFYLPAWVFIVSGNLPVIENEQQSLYQSQSSSRDISLLEQVVIPASKSLPSVRNEFFRHFDLDQAMPYDPAYLADWPAETYQISLSDASLQARWQVIQQIASENGLTNQQSGGSLIISSTNLQVQSFQLLLLPAWIAHLSHSAKQLTILVNGQNGEIHSDRPVRRRWLSWLHPQG